MTEVHVLTEEDKIQIVLSTQDAQILMTVIANFNREYAGPLLNLYQELDDAGVEIFSNLFLQVSTVAPELRLFLQAPEEEVEEVEDV